MFARFFLFIVNGKIINNLEKDVQFFFQAHRIRNNFLNGLGRSVFNDNYTNTLLVCSQN